MALRSFAINWILNGPISKYLPLNTLRALVRRFRYNRWNRNAFSDLYEHEKMLSDQVRVGNYAAGIKALVQPGQTVIDLGTGNGVLSVLAALRKPARVYAIDHSPFIAVAQHLAAANGCNNIDFIEKNSRDFEPEEKVDVILHEQMGDDLFSENMLDNILDLKARLLKQDGIVVPAMFDLYLEPVTLYDEYRVQRFHEHKIDGVDFSSFQDNPLIDEYRSRSYDRQFLPPSAFIQRLCKPEPLISIDLNELQSIDEISLQHNLKRQAIADGQLDGLVLYFRCRFTDTIEFDTSPFSRHTHWGNRFFRGESQAVKSGDQIAINIKMDAIHICTTWDYELRVEAAQRKHVETV